MSVEPESTPSAAERTFEPLLDALCHYAAFYLRCPICYDVIRKAKVIVLCGHVFCDKCIQRAFAAAPSSVGPQCPLCKTPVELDRSLSRAIGLGYLVGAANGTARMLGLGDDISDLTQSKYFDDRGMPRAVVLIPTKSPGPPILREFSPEELAFLGRKRSREDSQVSSQPRTVTAEEREHRCVLCPIDFECRPSMMNLLTFFRQKGYAQASDLNRSPDEVAQVIHTLYEPFPDTLPQMKAHRSCVECIPNANAKLFRNATRLSCALCGLLGASMGCRSGRCRRSFHLLCVMFAQEAVTLVDGRLYCTSCARGMDEESDG